MRGSNMKKRIFFLIIAFAVLMALSSCGSKTAGENSSHPYSWKEKRDGSVVLTIENAPSDGYNWAVSDSQENIISVEALENGKDGQAKFSITGQDTNVGTVTLELKRTAAPYDTTFGITLTLSEKEKGGITVSDTSFVEYTSAGNAGEDGKPSCVWYSPDNTSVNIYIADTDEAYDWKVLDFDDAIVTVSDPEYAESGTAFKVTGLAAGDTTVLIYDTEQDYGFSLKMTVADSLNVSVTEDTAGRFTVSADTLPGMNEVTSVVGEIKIPDTVSVIRCDSDNWKGDGNNDYSNIVIRSDNKDFSLIVTKAYDMDTVINMCYGSDEVTKTDTKIGNTDAVLCARQTENMLFWTDSDNRVFVLSSQSGDALTGDELVSTAKKVCGVE